MHDNHHRIVSFCAFCFVLVLSLSPAMKKFVFFRLAIFLPPEKKNPRDDAAREVPATKQAKGKSHANAWLLLVAETGLEPATSGL